MARTAKVARKTRETDISVELDLDGSGKADVETPLPFLSHMVEQIARQYAVKIDFDRRQAGLVLDQSLEVCRVEPVLSTPALDVGLAEQA